MDYEPSFQEKYKNIFENIAKQESPVGENEGKEECELPLIDLDDLNSGGPKREKCIKKMVKAAKEWGFFQVVNHGVPNEVLESMQSEEKKVFYHPLSKKFEDNFLNLPANSYRYGSPTAKMLRQFAWSEAFHIPLTNIPTLEGNLRSAIEAYATIAANLAKRVSEILIKNLGVESTDHFLGETFSPRSSFLRMNRYPVCPLPIDIFGLMPHTDTDFLTIVYQDTVGGLQLKKDGKWVNVRPDPQAFIINIGDVFQVYSNDVYKSIQHRVIAPKEVERFSLAYFFCPNPDILIRGCMEPALYKDFTFQGYKDQILQDVLSTGDKLGLGIYRN